MRPTFLRTFVLGILVATLIVPAGALQSLAQEKQQKPLEPETQAAITVDVPLVNVDVVVTDNRGTFITGLQKNNFRILEDGVPQSVTNFAPTEAPITIVMLLEFSRLGYGFFAYDATDWAYGFLNQLKKDDWVALVSFDLRTRIEVDFTRNKFEVQQHLSRMHLPSFS